MAGFFLSATLGATANAQASRYFEDSWFWGVKSGVATFSPTLGGNETAATYGAEWMITRTHGGLYVSFDEANVSTTSAVLDANTSDGFRPVTVSKLHRIGFAALAFPKRFGNVRPYAGLGLSALLGWGTETLVVVPATLVVAVYLLAAAAGLRLLTGTARLCALLTIALTAIVVPSAIEHVLVVVIVGALALTSRWLLHANHQPRGAAEATCLT